MAPSCSAFPFLVVNGAPVTVAAPPVSSFLESTPGAYTTTRTDRNASLILFWDRHLRRLADSARILVDSHPDLLGSARSVVCPANTRSLVHRSLRIALDFALRERHPAESTSELAITALLQGRDGDGMDVLLHIGTYSPPVFGAAGAHLAVAGRGREVAEAKYSKWAMVRKGMEKMRPPLATELLLSNDGDRILEGSVTNFFVVVRRPVTNSAAVDSSSGPMKEYSCEVQTAPISDGVLPGVIRQLVIEVCSSIGIPLKEVAPSWSERELWEEAFVTSSLRLLQHADTIQFPTSYKDLHIKTWKEVSWEMIHFEGVGLVTAQIQKAIVERAGAGGYQISNML